jgi:HlyD family secretion protein
VLAIIALAGYAGFAAYRSWLAEHLVAPVPGVVRVTEIHIAPEISARLASVLVTAGQRVRKGEILAVLRSPELTASVEEAKAALAQAHADRNNVFAGVREELVNISAQDVQIAEANHVLARQQYARSAELASKDFATKQALDEITTTLRKAEANLTMLRATYAQNKAGPTKEERASAGAKVVLAEAATADLEAKLAKTQLAAPVDGVIGQVVASPGEIISPGQSVMTIEAGRERWFTFSIREDRLRPITIGSLVRLLTAGGSTIKARVTELRPLGEFATWRAARAVGDHDLNSFLVRADPLEANEGLETGMTVWLEPVG